MTLYCVAQKNRRLVASSSWKPSKEFGSENDYRQVYVLGWEWNFHYRRPGNYFRSLRGLVQLQFRLESGDVEPV